MEFLFLLCSIWLSIYICKEYHNLYYDYYELKSSLNKVKVDCVCVSPNIKNVNLNSDKKPSAVNVNKLKKG